MSLVVNCFHSGGGRGGGGVDEDEDSTKNIIITYVANVIMFCKNKYVANT